MSGWSAVGVWRRWVFPSIKVVLVAAIAVALVKLAFFPDRQTEADAAVPSGSVVEPEVAVVRGSISNDLVLDGTVAPDSPAPVKASATGTVDEVFVAVGTAVAAGQKLYDIKVEDQPDAPVLGADGVPQPASPSFHFERVLAPIAGTLAALDVIPGQPVSTGDRTGSVAPATFGVSAALSPEQQYRLTSAPTEAVVTIAGGPAPFTCTGLTIANGSTPTASAQGGANPGEQGEPSAAGAVVRCAVPGDVRVFAGLKAKVEISAGSADDVLVVPVTAVEGGAESGVAWRTGGGAPVEQPVKLGLTDGSFVEIVEGLAEGDTVLEFVPGAAGGPGEEACVQMSGAGTVCGPVAG